MRNLLFVLASVGVLALIGCSAQAEPAASPSSAPVPEATGVEFVLSEGEAAEACEGDLRSDVGDAMFALENYDFERPSVSYERSLMVVFFPYTGGDSVPGMSLTCHVTEAGAVTAPIQAPAKPTD